MRRSIPVLFWVALLLTAGNLAADPIFSIEGGTLTATARYQSGASQLELDVRGAALLGVADPDLNLPRSPLFVYDSTWGTASPPDLPFGNQFLAGTTPYTPGTHDSAVIYFQFSNSHFAGPLLTIPALIAIINTDPNTKEVIVTNATTDPILDSLLGASPIPFDFTFMTGVTDPSWGALAKYDLVGVGSQIPEPSSLILLSAGCILLYGIRRRHLL